MSSYLNIYIKKKSKKEYTSILSYSRNNDIYQAINELGNFYSNDGTKYKLSSEVLNDAIQDCMSIINNSKNIIETIYNFRTRHDDDINEVTNHKEIIKEQESLMSILRILLEIEEQSKFDYIDSDGLYCNID